MAGFKTHITTSSLIGVAYGATATGVFDVPLASSVLAGGLCGVSGMLPDLDSGPGVPLRESVAFAAAVVPMLMIHRFQNLNMTPESMVLAGGAIYLAIRFGIAKLLKTFTVHRGMFHSLPAALIAGELAFLICEHEDLSMRYFNAGAIMLGFLSHLLLDEIWSIEMKRGLPHLKKSFGTALKFWGDCGWANVCTYSAVALLTFLALQDPVWMNESVDPGESLQRVANQALEKIMK